MAFAACFPYLYAEEDTGTAPLPDVSWNPRVSFAYDHGSWNNNTSDGKFRDFDALFLSGALYAFTDLIGIRSQNYFGAGDEVRPCSKILFSVTEHFYCLDSKKSNLYNTDPGVVRDTTPGASRTVGKGTDIFLNFTINTPIDGYLGYSYFLAGPFSGIRVRMTTRSPMMAPFMCTFDGIAGKIP